MGIFNNNIIIIENKIESQKKYRCLFIIKTLEVYVVW